jgi:hypothetical protein
MVEIDVLQFVKCKRFIWPFSVARNMQSGTVILLTKNEHERIRKEAGATLFEVPFCYLNEGPEENNDNPCKDSRVPCRYSRRATLQHKSELLPFQPKLCTGSTIHVQGHYLFLLEMFIC